MKQNLGEVRGGWAEEHAFMSFLGVEEAENSLTPPWYVLEEGIGQGEAL